MAEASPVADRRIHRRIVLEAAAAMAAAGPAVLLGGHAEAQPRSGGATALFAYVGAFTTPERKGHGGASTSTGWTRPRASGATNSSSKSPTPPSWRSTGRSAFSTRSIPTSTRSVPMRSTVVINELGSSVTTYRFDAQLGSLQPIQILPSIPASYTGNNTGAEIVVTPSGRVVYASNRGHDSIAIFAVDPREGP